MSRAVTVLDTASSFLFDRVWIVFLFVFIGACMDSMNVVSCASFNNLRHMYVISFQYVYVCTRVYIYI